MLIIGAGGAARAIAYTLEQEGAEISIANRSLKRAEELAALVGAMGFCLGDLQRLAPQADIIINCTSVGMQEGDPRLLEGRLLQSHRRSLISSTTGRQSFSRMPAPPGRWPWTE